MHSCPTCEALLGQTYFSTELSNTGARIIGLVRFNDRDAETKYSDHLRLYHNMVP